MNVLQSVHYIHVIGSILWRISHETYRAHSKYLQTLRRRNLTLVDGKTLTPLGEALLSRHVARFNEEFNRE